MISTFVSALATFLAGTCIGLILGWKLCRGLVRSQAVQSEQGQPLLRVTLDPGPFPWSGAETLLLDASEQ